jgi:hypothetical protein
LLLRKRENGNGFLGILEGQAKEVQKKEEGSREPVLDITSHGGMGAGRVCWL